MIKYRDLFNKFEDDFVRNKGKMPFAHAIKIFTSMWNEGLKFGVLPPKEPLEGIDIDIKIAKALNSCLKKSFPE